MTHIKQDSGLPQSYRAVVNLLFLFPDILDFLPAAMNGAVEQFECWLETGGAYSKYLEIQTMVNNVVIENVDICVSLCLLCFSRTLIFFAVETYAQSILK